MDREQATETRAGSRAKKTNWSCSWLLDETAVEAGVKMVDLVFLSVN